MLIGRTKDECMRWLAQRMDLDLAKPEDWPTAWMERLLSLASAEAERFIDDKVQWAMNRDYPVPRAR